MDINKKIAEEFSLTMEHTNNVVNLLDEGNTIPFIARYRKELTGHIDDQVLRNLADRLEYLRNLEKRKGEILKSIEEQGKLTDEIVVALSNAQTKAEAEDIYRPFKPKKKTRATIAISKGLSPLADTLLLQDISTNPLFEGEKYINKELGVESVEDALQGAKDIIAEIVSDNAELRKKLRKMFLKLGVVSACFTKKGLEDEEKSGVYETYKEYQEPITQIKSYRVLALNRGENEEVLNVKIKIDNEFALSICSSFFVKGESKCKAYIEDAIKDSYSRLIEPSIEREVRNVLTEIAEEQAIKMFEVNLRPLLMQPPLKGKIVMGFDPGVRTGCKIAIVDETGKVLDKTVVYPTLDNDKKIEEANVELKRLILKHNVEIIAIGNGTASKKSEIFIANLIKEFNGKVSYAVVSEAGASVYSASSLGAKEFPDYDVSERSAVSIARRLQDPLAELIKIDPKSIGVGQYQHDMPQARLSQVLGGTVEDCVNAVGVDLNTASVSLLSYVAGLNSGIATSIIEYREKNGKFTNRKQLLKVKKLGDKAFTQCAGFLKVVNGDDILDNTSVHPESYEGVKKLITMFGYTDKDIINGNLQELPEKIKKQGYSVVSSKCGLGEDTLKDVIVELLKPGRDVRDSLPKPVLRADLLEIEDLKEGMEINGVVRNVIDFGAFVDIGVHQDGLVHISQLSNNFVKHPSDVVKVGDSVKVKVLSVDVKKKRIALTMKF